MRKTDRDGIVELIPSIQNAMDYCEKVDFAIASALFDDCEAALTSILNILKSQLSYSTKDSYELLFEKFDVAIQVLHNGKTIKIQSEFYQDTKINLSILMTKVMQEIVQYEVVFLPYNATMWDSLESIWLAAKDDSRCICYVVPIPYYDKNGDGSFGTMHYEGNQFPDYVPITHFDKYNIEQRRPDIVYIHNPYDKFNKVTSVHPTYYSYNIKPYIKMLVYVPYFIAIDHIQEDFCILPGVRFADKVIVQSEKIAEEYKKFYPGEDKDKFLPLGSPKMDKVIQMSKLSREKLNIPEEWKRLIGDKKVILYNTHLNTLINNGEKTIKKLHYVFSCFEHRDDVVLLWRPHPLSEATVEAMNPSIMNAYKRIEDEYREKGFGIYDDTPDLHRTLARVDAYLGDWSSLVPMVGVAGKPIMIQDLTRNQEQEVELDRRIPFEDIYIDGDGMWFASSAFNALFYMDRKTGKTEYIGRFPDENLSGIRLYSKVVRYKDKLIFVPFNANSIAEYNLINGAFKKIKIKNDCRMRKFVSYAVYDGCIYLMPLHYSSVIRYNIEIEELEYMDSWNEVISEYTINKNDFLFRDIYLQNNKLYCPMAQNNIMLKFDLQTFNVDIYEFKNKDDIFSGIQFDGENFWLFSKKKCEILCWNEKNSNVEYISEFPEKFVCERDYDVFLTTMYLEGKIWILPCRANSLIQFDIKTKEIKLVNFENKLINKHMTNNMFWMYGGIHCDNNEILLFQLNTDGMVVTDNSRNEKYVQKVLYPENWEDIDILKYSCDKYSNFMEGNYGLLDTYIDFVRNRNDGIKNVDNLYFNDFFENDIESCGIKINDYLLNLLEI